VTAAAVIIVAATAAFAAAQPNTVDAVMAVPNLERRSDLALRFAHSSLDGARKAYDAGDLEAMRQSLATALAGVDLSWESLKATGKNPRRSPRYFKRAEIEVRKLLKRLADLRDAVSIDDRPPVEEAYAHADKALDRLVAAVMSKK
jgi:hypothetical protein